MSWAARLRNGGSSPRVRGKQRERLLHEQRPGLIPARAGKTLTGHASYTNWQAHPRACGENCVGMMLAAARAGSSPRVRGKLESRLQRRAPAGLIPARAGKTPPGAGPPSGRAAHPRACGENGVDLGAAQAAGGSSPRVRGKLAVGRRSTDPRGLIPARAGKTGARPCTCCDTGAHPRACGENSRTVDHDGDPDGSSPRVRGKQPHRRSRRRPRRLIPARAGKTPRTTPSNPRSRAHPRACGENVTVDGYAADAEGSSPRVRGKQRERPLDEPQPGLIPARAGKTDAVIFGAAARTAHPRACGENLVSAACAVVSVGSSPRVRGKLRGHVHSSVLRGLIPARAGKTWSHTV